MCVTAAGEKPDARSTYKHMFGMRVDEEIDKVEEMHTLTDECGYKA